MKKKTLGVFFTLIFLISVINLVSTSAAMINQGETNGEDNSNLVSQEAVSTISNPVLTPEESIDDLNTVDRQPGPERTSQESTPINSPDVYEPVWNSPAAVSNPFPGDAKRIFTYVEIPNFNTHVGEIFDIRIVVENYEYNLVTVNLTLEIAGFVVYSEESIDIMPDSFFDVYVNIEVNASGIHYVESIVDNYGQYYFGPGNFRAFDLDQVVILYYQPNSMPTSMRYNLTVRFWNLYSSPVQLTAVTCTINGTTVGTHGDINLDPGPFSVDSFFDVFFDIEIPSEEGMYETTVSAISSVDGPISWSNTFNAWSDYWMDDYEVTIEQYPEYEMEEMFKIVVYVESYTWISREVHVYVETVFEDGTSDVLADLMIWVEGNRFVMFEFELSYYKTGQYDVYAEIEFTDEFGLVEVYQANCFFNIVDYLPDYMIWINQQYMYPVDEHFTIYLEVTSNVGFEQDVQVYSEINGSVVYDGYVTIAARGSVSLGLGLTVVAAGYFEITATVGDGTGFIYGDAFCYFWIADFSNGYEIYIDQRDWYKANNDHFMILHVASFTDVDRYVNITLEFNRVVYHTEINFWMGNESYEEIWVYFNLENIGGYDVYAYVDIDAEVVAEDRCYFDLISPNWCELWIEQDWGYEIDTLFNVWVWIKSNSLVDYDVVLTLESIDESGYVKTEWTGPVFLSAQSETSFQIPLYFEKYGHYDLHAYVEYVFNDKPRYYDTWCGFDIVDYIPDYYIRIEQDYVYTLYEAFSIYVVVESNIDISTVVTLNVDLNGSIIFYENITIEAYGNVDIQLSLNLSVTGFNDVYAWIDDPIEDYFIADAWCGFWIREYADYYLFIEQRDSYQINTDFYIKIWIQSNIAVSQQFNLTVHVDGEVEYFEENIWVDGYAVLKFDIWLHREIVGGYEVNASIKIDDTVIAVGTCYFEMVDKWIDIWIEQDEFYPAYQNFFIIIRLRANYGTNVSVRVEVDGRPFDYHWYLNANQDFTFQVNLYFDYEGWMDVYAHVEDAYSHHIWNEADCGFYVGFPSEYDIWIEQDFAYVIGSMFSVNIWIYSKIDMTQTGHLVVEVDSLGIVWEDDVTVSGYSEMIITVEFTADEFIEEGFYGIRAFFGVEEAKYEAFCGFNMLVYQDFWVLIIQKEFYEINKPLDIGIIIISNVDYATYANLSLQIGTLYEDDTIYLYPYEHKEIWINQMYAATGHVDVNVELEVRGIVYSADCGFDVIEGGSDEIIQVIIDASDRYDVGVEFFVKFRIKNNGMLNEPVKIEIFENGIDIYSVSRDLLPGETWEFIMTFQYDSEGTIEFQLRADSTISDRLWSTTKDIRIGEEEVTTTETTPSTTSDTPVFSPGFDLVTAVVALLSAIAVPVMVRNRRKK